MSSTLLIISLLSPQKVWSMQPPDPVDHKTVKKIVKNHLKANPALLDSSKDKDIVVFLGNTGAGKSTLINYLSDKKLKVNDLDDIILDDPNDPLAMAIGGGSVSETFLPAFAQVNGLLFYDLPGFKDTRGTAKSLVNACFIKHIIENARTAKLVFVAGMDQITSDRGSSFKVLLSQVKQLIPNSTQPIETFSSLVITKSHTNTAKLPAFLKAKVDLLNPGFEILEFLIDGQLVEQMSKPMNSSIDPQDRDNILKVISGMGQTKIANIDISVVYDTNQKFEIKKIYDAEIDDIVETLILQHVDVQTLSSLDKASLETKRDDLAKNFNSQVCSSLDGSSLITLLRPISENLYQASWSDKNQTLAIRLDNIIGQINMEIKEKEKQEEERQRLAAEAALRQEQARVRAAQEQAIILQQEVKRLQEAERQRQAEEQKKRQIEQAREAEKQRQAERAREAERMRTVEKAPEIKRELPALCKVKEHYQYLSEPNWTYCRYGQGGMHEWHKRKCSAMGPNWSDYPYKWRCGMPECLNDCEFWTCMPDAKITGCNKTYFCKECNNTREKLGSTKYEYFRSLMGLNANTLFNMSK